MPNSWTSTQENQAVEAYLQYVATKNLPPDPNYTRKAEHLDQRIANEPRLFRKVQLIAERQALEGPAVTPEDLVENFVKFAGAFSERTGVSYTAWREMGVPTTVLERAGIQGAKSSKKMAPDDPNRVRPYHPRKMWSPDEKAEYVAFYEANGGEATAERFSVAPSSVVQRYYGFRSEARKAAGEPPRRKAGRPKKVSNA